VTNGGDAVAGSTLELERGGRRERTAMTDGEGGAVFFHLGHGEWQLRLLPGGGGAVLTTTVRLDPGAHHCVALEILTAEAESLRSGSVACDTDPPGTTFPIAERRELPQTADPWSWLRQSPGVVLDRDDVGPSGTGQQSLLVTPGDPGTGAVWTLDGIDVTDPAALGFSSIFPDSHTLEALQVRTNSLDVRV